MAQIPAVQNGAFPRKAFFENCFIEKQLHTLFYCYPLSRLWIYIGGQDDAGG